VPARLRAFREEDIPDGLRLSRGAGWNQREEDWRELLALGPDRFVAAELDGRVVGTGGAACYGDALAWICMIIVDPLCRGAGLGTRIVEAAVERAAGVRIVGLDATPQGQHVYERLGFAESGLVLRMQARDAHPVAPETDAVTDMGGDVPESVLRWDAEVFGADRGTALQWLRRQGRGWLAGGASRPTGYAFLREGEHSRHVGPVVAKDVGAAESLVAAALGRTGPGPVIIDAAAGDQDWLARLHRLGFVEKRRLTRMYRAPGSAPGQPDVQRAIFGPEFG